MAGIDKNSYQLADVISAVRQGVLSQMFFVTLAANSSARSTACSGTIMAIGSVSI